MMGDTPSNYNVVNGRLDGKSQGLKAIQLKLQKQIQKVQQDLQMNEIKSNLKDP